MFARDSGHAVGERARGFGRARRAAFLARLKRGAIATALADGAVLRLPEVLRGGDDLARPRAQGAGAGGGRRRIDRGQVRRLRRRVLARLLLLGGEVEARLWSVPRGQDAATGGALQGRPHTSSWTATTGFRRRATGGRRPWTLSLPSSRDRESGIPVHPRANARYFPDPLEHHTG